METLRTTQLAPEAGVIDLGIGQPGMDLLPLEAMRRAAADRLAGDPSLLAYGYEKGDGGLRGELARFLAGYYGGEIDPGQLFVTAGASQGLDLLCTLFARPGDTVWVEAPTYFLALRIFADHGLKVQALPMDEAGLRTEVLAERLAQSRPAFLYTVPAFHNPTGCVLGAERRRRLVDLSREHGLLVVADEVYHLLSHGARLPRPLAAAAGEAPVVSLGSFSKILAPGLRLGWVQAGPQIMARLAGCGLVDSGGGLNPFTANIVGRAIALGLARSHLEFLRAEYARRRAALLAALGRHFPAGASFRDPGGGFFVWVGLPAGMDAERLLPAARRRGAGFLPGSRCAAGRRGFEHWVRLSFAFYGPDEIAEGVRRLASAMAGLAGGRTR